jgi:hypothetical protein
MATQQINGDPVTTTSTKNNSGTITSFGSNSGTFSLTPPSTDSVGVFGSTVIDGNDTDAANSAGVFAFSNQKPVAVKLTDSLAEVSNDFLLSGANDPASFKAINNQLVEQSGNLVDGVRTRQQTKAIREGKFDIYTGKYDAGYPDVTVDEFTGADGVSGDTAGKPTRLDPGSLVYKGGISEPVTKDYEKKTG